jgi:hypothetical protein
LQKEELELELNQLRISSEVESKANVRKVSEARVAAAELGVQVADLKAEVDTLREQCARAEQLEVRATRFAVEVLVLVRGLFGRALSPCTLEKAK